jgi:DNA-binding transcriptional LysR family regulator
MPLRLPPLSGLRLFEAAARCGSFKQAALELGVTPGALTHAIDSLEQSLDVQLFERHARGVVLTAAGRQYLPYVTEGLATIAAGTLRLPSRRFEDRLSISSFSLFAYKLLFPRLHRFQALHPDTIVNIDVSRQVVQLPSEQFDIAIRSGHDAWPKLSCELLGRVSFVPVGAPHYIQEHSRGGVLDWSRITLIRVPSSAEDWETWCNYSNVNIESPRNIIVTTVQLALEAAADGLGLAIGRLPAIDDDIAAGRLAVAVDHVVPTRTGYWLVQPPGTETRREIIAFKNWLMAEMAQLRWDRHTAGRAALHPA